MAEEQVYDWSTAPTQMREAFERMQADHKAAMAQAEKDRARLAEVDRRDRFAELKAAGGDALKDVSLEDIGDMVAEQITPTILQAKALEKAQSQQAALASLAKDAGFASVEEMQAFRTAAAERQAATLQAQGITAATATAGQTFNEPVVSPGQAAYDTFAEEKAKGTPPDEARGKAVAAMFAAQMAKK